MISIFLSGCLGRMGQVITSLAHDSDDLRVVAGSDLNTNTDPGYPVYQAASECKEEFDVIIDFSNPAALPELFALMRKSGKPAVICTTGLSDDQKSELSDISKQQAVFISANMSLGINILIHLAKQAAQILYPDFDLEIVEAHHKLKVDAPSGTALMIADELNNTLDNQLEYVYDRSSKREKRAQKELGLHAIRGGTIVGEHTVIFAGGEETLSIHHSAQSRDVFARGALAAAKFMNGKEAGMYSMKDLIGTINS
ncbi:MAG: 4-hydroxy-tetrahydrodipicolinate reductase [Clostridiales bacterium]|jgi:4-hydroxy-tetrahydrodipicolinate reductase|nr:4-hydroxy-tetrahydrodipicolinate reductase [Clostridiales bacterium]